MEAVSFGPFRLYPAQRLLKKGEDPVRLGARAFDILLALVERAGEVVAHKELIAEVWPNVIVEEIGLRVHITSLRKALDGEQSSENYVTDVKGRGYRGKRRWLCCPLFVTGSLRGPKRQICRKLSLSSAIQDRLLSPLLAHRVISVRYGIWSISGHNGLWRAVHPADLWAHALVGAYAEPREISYPSVAFWEFRLKLCKQGCLARQGLLIRAQMSRRAAIQLLPDRGRKGSAKRLRNYLQLQKPVRDV